MKVLWSFLWRDIQNEISYRLSFALQMLSIFPAVAMFYFLGRLFDGMLPASLQVYGGHYFPFVLIGIAVQNYLTVALGSFSASIREDQMSGTLEAILVTPVPLPIFLLGSTLYAFFINSIRVILYLLVGTLLCGVTLAWSRLPSVFVVLLLTVIAFSSLGVLASSYILVFKRGDPLNWVFNVASWLLGGVYYPVSILPEWLKKIAEVIPMTHSLEALRLLLLTDRSMAEVIPHFLMLVFWVLTVLPVSYLCFCFALRRARVTGTLGHY